MSPYYCLFYRTCLISLDFNLTVATPLFLCFSAILLIAIGYIASYLSSEEFVMQSHDSMGLGIQHKPNHPPSTTMHTAGTRNLGRHVWFALCIIATNLRCNLLFREEFL
ncbi:hypothetical protein ILYODFUR_021254 [Ilyodon furcidens]|uniref:Uncharacterized protein n=1 Tax=Ilyodon furcidens TaxID=33524 RepID=A0ABV0V6J8_9TELE